MPTLCTPNATMDSSLERGKPRRWPLLYSEPIRARLVELGRRGVTLSQMQDVCGVGRGQLRRFRDGGGLNALDMRRLNDFLIVQFREWGQSPPHTDFELFHEVMHLFARMGWRLEDAIARMAKSSGISGDEIRNRVAAAYRELHPDGVDIWIVEAVLDVRRGVCRMPDYLSLPGLVSHHHHARVGGFLDGVGRATSVTALGTRAIDGHFEAVQKWEGLV